MSSATSGRRVAWRPAPISAVLAAMVLGIATSAAVAQGTAPVAPGKAKADPRVLTLATDGETVIEVPVQRGQLTHVVLPEGENVTVPPATGQGARCDDDNHAWCIVAHGRDLFIKAKPSARTNNLILITERRRFAFDLRAVDRGGLMRLTLLPPASADVSSAASPAASPLAASAPTPDRVQPVRATAAAQLAQALLQERLQSAPVPRNSQYSMAVGKSADDIAPTLVFDDGRCTYFRFPGNRPLPAVFQVSPDGSEETVNVRMGEDDLLVADRVARKFFLRLGKSVVAVVNDAYDPNGLPAVDGTTVPGVARSLSQGARPVDAGIPGLRTTTPGAAASPAPSPAAAARTSRDLPRVASVGSDAGPAASRDPRPVSGLPEDGR